MHRKRPKGLVFVAALFALLLGAPAGAAAASPVDDSTILGGITWDMGSKHRYAPGADLWFTTWASDDALYANWGDGWGFSSLIKYRLGISKLTGTPSDPGGADVYYGTTAPPPEVPCGDHPEVGGYTAGPGLALPRGVQWLAYWNTDSCLNTGVIQVPTALAKSEDQAVSWTPRVLQAWPDAAGLFPTGFLQYGRAYAGSLDRHAYIYMTKSPDHNGRYVARVPTDSIGKLKSYRYYAGNDRSGNPKWSSSSASAQPTFTDASGQTELNQYVVFNPGIGRYISVTNHGNEGFAGYPAERQLGIFDAPTPWGPWTTVTYEENFDNTDCGANCLGNGIGLGMSFPQKWMSPDGLTMSATYSSQGGYDSLNTIDGTLSLRSGARSASIKSIRSTDANGERIPVVTDSLSLSHPGNLQYIDSEARLRSMFGGYENDEMIRLRNADKTNKSANYLSFELTADTYVRIGWPKDVAVPKWLRGWRATAHTLVGDREFRVYEKWYTAGSTVTLPGANNKKANYIPFIDS